MHIVAFDAVPNVVHDRFGRLHDRYNAMTNTTLGLGDAEIEILGSEVSDAALESAAGTAKDKANFTLGACTGLSVCGG